MALKFKGTSIKGSHGPLVVGGPALKVRRVGYWDVRGEGEIVGRQSGRPISCLIILHDGYTRLDRLLTALAELADLIGEHGRLEETGNLVRTFDNVTFEGYDPIPLEGQDQPGPLKDLGVLTRQAGNKTEPDNGWFAQYLLRFYQLRT